MGVRYDVVCTLKSLDFILEGQSSSIIPPNTLLLIEENQQKLW